MVGDASQTIYSFTGASSAYLLDFARTHRKARGRPAGARLPLDPADRRCRERGDPPGPRRRGETAPGTRRSTAVRCEPEIRSFADESAEAAAVAARCAALRPSGVPAKEIAVLFRMNAQSETYERPWRRSMCLRSPRSRALLRAARDPLGDDRAPGGGTVDPGRDAIDRGGGRGAGGGRLAARREPAGGAVRERWEACPAFSVWPRSSTRPRRTLSRRRRLSRRLDVPWQILIWSWLGGPRPNTRRPSRA